MTDPATDRGPDTGPLERALSHPGTPGELADRERYLELYRREHPGAPTRLADRRRHAVRRLGAGGALAVVLAVGGGGVAAALNGALPDPLQRITHRVLAPVGVPPAPPADPAPAPSVAVAPGPTASTEPGPSASATPQGTPARSDRPDRPDRPDRTREPVRRPGGGALGADPTPSADPSAPAVPAPTATAGGEPSPTADPSATSSSGPAATADPSDGPALTAGPVIGRRPADLTTTLDTGRVAAGGRVVLTATVDAGDGSPVARATVVLEQRTGAGWREVTTQLTDDDGLARLSSGPVVRTTDFRMRSGRVTGRPVRVSAVPTLSVSRGIPGRRTVWVTVTAYGGQRGDVVRLMGLRGGRPVVVDRARLGRDKSASFDVALGREPVTYGAVIARTGWHAAARVEVVVPARSGAAGPAAPAIPVPPPEVTG